MTLQKLFGQSMRFSKKWTDRGLWFLKIGQKFATPKNCPAKKYKKCVCPVFVLVSTKYGQARKHGHLSKHDLF
jgi:hypothetical protein